MQKDIQNLLGCETDNLKEKLEESKNVQGNISHNLKRISSMTGDQHLSTASKMSNDELEKQLNSFLGGGAAATSS